ncbi:MBL fold metallo-hydrolase [Haloimpatiens sp. FM7315]|uniref:MBL fold metallo-hydrolase n=1 Tax=Haloimpatiens sp. FM7315 TaxID=3298609 RepID=UPI00397768EC
MDIKHVKGKTYCIDTGMTYIPYYKINEKDIIMLDTGWAKGEREGINEVLEMNEFNVVGIICTHFHIDHVGNCAYLKEKYNCSIAMPAYEALVCSSSINLKLYYSSQTLTDVEEHYGEAIFKTDIMISLDQEKVSLNGEDFKIVHTPGHSPAHICVITPDDVAYVGDSLISYEVMVNAKMPYAYILLEDLKSKKKLYDLKCSKYVVAHKGMYDDITKLIEDNIYFYRGRARGVYSVIKGSMTMEDILKASIEKFKISVKTKFKYNFMERMLKSYVEYLNEIGIIKLNIEDGFLKYTRASESLSGKVITNGELDEDKIAG